MIHYINTRIIDADPGAGIQVLRLIFSASRAALETDALRLGTPRCQGIYLADFRFHTGCPLLPTCCSVPFAVMIYILWVCVGPIYPLMYKLI